LDVAVKDFEEFGVDQMEIFAHHDADFVRFYRDNVDDLLDNLVPDQFRVAAEQRDVDLVVNVTDVILIGILFVLETDFLVVLELAWAIPVDRVQHLRVLADAGRAVKYQIRQLVNAVGEFCKIGHQLGVQIKIVHRSQVFVEMGLVVFHSIREYTPISFKPFFGGRCKERISTV
jgi:hypothetical protein